MILEDLYCVVDDFCKEFMPEWYASLIENKVKQKPWSCQMSPSEIMVIMILFHQQQYRNFKAFYLMHVQQHMKKDFPKLLSYSRFVEQMQSITVPLFFFLMQIPKAETGDIVVNSRGEIMNLKLTSAKEDDRKPVEDLTHELFGKLVGDKGYISKTLKEKLLEKGLELLTKVRKNMKPQDMTLMNKLLLRKRAIVETVIDQLKNVSQIEHSRHRSQNNFLTNLIAGLTAYALQPKKPSIEIDGQGMVVV